MVDYNPQPQPNTPPGIVFTRDVFNDPYAPSHPGPCGPECFGGIPDIQLRDGPFGGGQLRNVPGCSERGQELRIGLKLDPPHTISEPWPPRIP